MFKSGVSSRLVLWSVLCWAFCSVSAWAVELPQSSYQQLVANSKLQLASLARLNSGIASLQAQLMLSESLQTKLSDSATQLSNQLDELLLQHGKLSAEHEELLSKLRASENNSKQRLLLITQLERLQGELEQKLAASSSSLETISVSLKEAQQRQRSEAWGRRLEGLAVGILVGVVATLLIAR